MKRSIFVACLCAVALAGCGRTIVRETVVERPVVAAPATVIERQVVTPERIAAGPASCTLGSSVLASGSLSCQAGDQYVCSNGRWERIRNSTC